MHIDHLPGNEKNKTFCGGYIYVSGQICTKNQYIKLKMCYDYESNSPPPFITKT